MLKFWREKILFNLANQHSPPNLMRVQYDKSIRQNIICQIIASNEFLSHQNFVLYSSLFSVCIHVLSLCRPNRLLYVAIANYYSLGSR